MELETLDELAEPDTLPRRSYTERTGGPGSVRIHSVAKPAAKTKAADERDNNNNSSGGEADDADLAFLLDESTSNGDMPCTYGCGFTGSNADQLKAHEESCEHFYMNPRSKSQREYVVVTVVSEENNSFFHCWPLFLQHVLLGECSSGACPSSLPDVWALFNA